MITGKNYSFGRADITLVSITKTLDPMGGVATVSEATSTISGDVQFVTKDDKNLIEMGLAEMGDAKLFVETTVTVNVWKDEIDIDSVRWRVTELFEGPEVDGNTVHKGYILKRKFKT